MRDVYVTVMRDLNEVGAYFDRVDDLYLHKRIRPQSTHRRHLKRHPLLLTKINAKWIIEALWILIRLMRRVPDAALRRTYAKRMARIIVRRPSPLILQIYAIKCAMHYHAYMLVEHMRKRDAIVNSF